MNAVSSEQMAAMLRDALAEVDEPKPTVINSSVNWDKWGNNLLWLVGGVAIGSFYVSAFCFEEFQPIGYGPALISLAPGIQNPVSLFLDQYRQTESQSLSVEMPPRPTRNQRFQRSPQFQEDSSARI